MKIRPVGAKLFRADGQTDELEDRQKGKHKQTKLIVFFAIYERAQKGSKSIVLRHLIYIFVNKNKLMISSKCCTVSPFQLSKKLAYFHEAWC